MHKHQILVFKVKGSNTSELPSVKMISVTQTHLHHICSNIQIECLH